MSPAARSHSEGVTGGGNRVSITPMGSGKIRIGLSGWSYKDWRGDFYPDGLPQKQELAYAAARFPTLEINGTFYGLSTPKTMRGWYETASAEFVYAVKGSRFITHNKKLSDVDEPLANFMASGILELREKLGPILWQLGRNLHFDAGRMDRFLAQLPRDLEEVAVLAGEATLKRPSTTERLGANHRVRHVIEPRHESFFVADMARLARRHNVAIAFSHSSAWPYTEELTAGFVYLRLHGPGAPYSSVYTRGELEGWASRIMSWADRSEPEDARRLTDLEPPKRKHRDVYVYFDNDAGGQAPRQAADLIRLLVPPQQG
jgi:uncharacterized protein YecE (DUF72 family)